MLQLETEPLRIERKRTRYVLHLIANAVNRLDECAWGKMRHLLLRHEAVGVTPI